MQIYNIILNVIVNNEEAREVKMEKRKGLFQVPSFSDPLGIRIFLFISLIINLFEEISDNPPPNSL